MKSCSPFRAKSSGNCSSIKSNKSHSAKSLKDLVKIYIESQKKSVATSQCLSVVLDHYRGMNSLEDVIKSAAFAKTSEGKRHSHQYRIRKSAMVYAEKVIKSEIKKGTTFQSFDDLHEWFSGKCSNKKASRGKGLGPLYVYDTCLRIGAYLKLEPDHIYLHAGALIGARALLGVVKSNKLMPQDLPLVLHSLKPYEIEDFLCIFKKELRKFKR